MNFKRPNKIALASLSVFFMMIAGAAAGWLAGYKIDFNQLVLTPLDHGLTIVIALSVFVASNQNVKLWLVSAAFSFLACSTWQLDLDRLLLTGITTALLVTWLLVANAIVSRL